MSTNKSEQSYVGSSSWYAYWNSRSKDEIIKELEMILKKRDKAMTKLINNILSSDTMIDEACYDNCPATDICLKHGNISCSETINIWANM